jgi:hypothetical protein
VHQHVCNRKFLYFIIKLTKLIEWLEKHNLLIFLKRERIVAKQILIKHKRWNLGCYIALHSRRSHAALPRPRVAPRNRRCRLDRRRGGAPSPRLTLPRRDARHLLPHGAQLPVVASTFALPSSDLVLTTAVQLLSVAPTPPPRATTSRRTASAFLVTL